MDADKKTETGLALLCTGKIIAEPLYTIKIHGDYASTLDPLHTPPKNDWTGPAGKNGRGKIISTKTTDGRTPLDVGEAITG